MNAHANLTHWSERTDLAAAFRWTVKLNLHEAVANHFSLAVNPEGTRFLINPNGRHFGRITASSLVEIDANDPNTMDRPDAPDPTAWGLHGSIHRALPHARCVMHVHSIHATVLASLADGVIAIELRSSKPGALSFTSSLSSLQPNAKINTQVPGQIEITGTAASHEGVPGLVRFNGIAAFKHIGGKISSNGHTIVVENANAVTIYLAIATNFISYKNISGDEKLKAREMLNRALPKKFEAVLKAHQLQYHK